MTGGDVTPVDLQSSSTLGTMSPDWFHLSNRVAVMETNIQDVYCVFSFTDQISILHADGTFTCVPFHGLLPPDCLCLIL